MNNLYLIETNNFKLIDKETKKILKENNFSEDELIKYDLSTTKTTTLINELDTYSIFQDKKVVLGYDAVFLTTLKSEIEQDIKGLEDYINNPNPSNILILACSKLDGKKNICKLIKSKFKIIDLNINLVDYVKENLDDYKMNIDTINYFLLQTGDNIERIDNELVKLKSFKNEEKVINKDDVLELVIPQTDDNIFNLMDAIVKKDKKRSLKIYNDLINNKVEVIKILINLSYQFRLIYQVKVLEYKSDSEIAEILNIKNPKQIRAVRYKTNNFNERELLRNLEKLAIIDEEIKTSKILPEIAIPMFITNL